MPRFSFNTFLPGFLICLLITVNLFGQSLKWVKQVSGVSLVEGRCIGTDSLNHVYTVGFFKGTVDLDPDTSVTSFTAVGSGDMYISKSDSSGALVWAKQVKFADPKLMKVDARGNIFIAGIFKFNVDFDPGAGTTILSSGIDYDVFILKLNSSGNFQWVKQIGDVDYDFVRCLTLDNQGNIYLGGPFKDYNDVDPGINQVLIHSNNGPYYLVKLDPYGNYVWHKQYGDESTTFNGISLTADANANLYLGGYFEGTTDFDLGPDTTNLTSTPWTESAFITKLDMNGNYQWAKHYPDQNAPSRITSVAVNSFSNVYISGQFSGSIDFDPDSATYLLTHNYGAQFISKLTNNGKFIWANMIGSSPNYSGGPWFTQLTTDIFGTVYFGGTFTHTVDFDPSPSVFNLGINSGIDNLFIMKLNAAGDFSWAKSFEGYYDHKYLNDLHLGYDGQIYATGSFKDSIDFGQINTQPTMLHSLGDYDAFNLKVRECSVIGPRQNISECDSFLWPVDSSLYAQSGTYLSVLKGNGGCDSIIIMDLTINNIDITVTTHGHTLAANDSSANYQWLSCDSNFIAISGDTSQSFIPAQNGTYAVALEKGGCMDTSICYLVNSVSLNSELAEPTIAVYPNPFQKGIRISNLPHNGCSELLITDLAGHLLIRQAGPTGGEHYLDLNTLPLGIYILRLRSDQIDRNYRIVKE